MSFVGAGHCDDTLKLATLASGLAAGTPYFVARDVPCEMCEDVPCAKVCPSGALDADIASIDDARMGLAVLLDHENCLNYQGLRCDVCYRVCPSIDRAITLEMERNMRTGKHARFLPTVHSDACTGCGKCEQACVLDQAAIKVLPRSAAICGCATSPFSLRHRAQHPAYGLPLLDSSQPKR